MNKREAAEYLGVSIRSLERYTEKKLLPCHYEEGRIDKRPVYDTPDLETFKQGRDARKKRQAVEAVSPDALKRIGFRLDSHYIERLTDEGAKHNMSAGEYARRLLIGAMEDFRHQEVLAHIELLRQDLDSLRGDIAQTIEAFLLHVVDQADREEAVKWVRTTLSDGRKGKR